MRQDETFVLRSDTGAELHGVVEFSGKPGPRPTILICHGFKGFFEWGFFPPLATLLRERGFTVARFNFSGSGMRPGDELVSRPQDFHDNLLSHDRDEALRMIRALGEEIAPGRVDRERIGVLGHSRGGGSAILAAARCEDVRALVTWNAVSTFRRFGPAEETWRRGGKLPIVNGRTGQELTMGVAILDELAAKADDLDVLRAAAAVRAPWRIVHGELDETVPLDEARALDEAATAKIHDLEVIAGGDHTFGAKHPFVGPTRELITAMNATQTFFRRHLG